MVSCSDVPRCTAGFSGFAVRMLNDGGEVGVVDQGWVGVGDGVAVVSGPVPYVLIDWKC